MDEQRTGIWRRVAEEDDSFRLEPLGRGAPVVHRYLAPTERAQQTELASSEVLLQLSRRWPDGRETRREWWSAEAIRKGQQLDRLDIRDAGNAARDRWAQLILAQLDAFADQVERAVLIRHAGLADEDATYTLPDGRIVFDDGSVEPGEIGGGPPLLGPRRAARWRARFDELPDELPTPAELAGATASLLAFDPKGRALCAAMLGVRALFYSLVPMRTFVLLTGLRGTGKTTTGQMLHWAEGPCAAGDEPDLAFRTTALGAELLAERRHDGVFLIDDLQRTHAAPGAELEPHARELVKINGRAAFDGAPLKMRGNRGLTLSPSRHVQSLLAFSAETAAGLEPSLAARAIWWPFEAGEITLAPLVNDRDETPAWVAAQEAFTAIGHALIRNVLQRIRVHGRADAAEFIRSFDRDAAELVGALPIGGAPEDRARIAAGLSMIVSAGMLCDLATADDTMRDLAFSLGGQLAQAQAERIASGQLDGGGFDRAWFRAVYEAMEPLLLDAETGRAFRYTTAADEAELMAIGYRLGVDRDGLPTFTPAGRKPIGWRHRARREDWLRPAAFLEACERRARGQGTPFPFTSHTLPAQLARVGFTLCGEADEDGHTRHAPRVRIGPELRAYVLKIAIEDEAEALSPVSPHVPPSDSAWGDSYAVESKAKNELVPPVPPISAISALGARPHARENIEEFRPKPKTEPTARTPEGGSEPRFWRERIAAWGPDELLIGEADGEITRLKHATPTPPLGELLAHMIERRITQLWLHPAAGLPAELPRDAGESDGFEHAWASGELPAGWGMKKAGRLKPWMKFYREGASGTVAISVPQLDGRVRWSEASTPDELLRAALMLKANLGVSYKTAPGAFFKDIVTRSRRRGAFEASISPAEFPEAWRDPRNVAPEFAWQRPLTAAERKRRFVWAFDLNSAHVYAMNGLRLGLGRPLKADAPPFDAKRAGLWFARLGASDRLGELLPHPLYRARWPSDYATPAWYPTAQLADAQAAGLAVEVAEAWLYPETRPMLAQTYAQLRDALGALERADEAGDAAAQLAIGILKDTRTSGLGWFDVTATRESDEPDDFHRPDWYAEIRAGSAATVRRQLRRAHQLTGRAPFAINVDAAYFATDAATPIEAAAELGLPLGRRLGVFKPQGHAELAPLLDRLRRKGNHLGELGEATKSRTGRAKMTAALRAALRAADDAAAAKRKP